MSCSRNAFTLDVAVSSPQSSPWNRPKRSYLPLSVKRHQTANTGCSAWSEGKRDVAQLGSAPALGAGSTPPLTWEKPRGGALLPLDFPSEPAEIIRLPLRSPLRPTPKVPMSWGGQAYRGKASMSQQTEQSSGQTYASARAIAERWSCHVDTVYSRLSQAGVPSVRFSSRFIRWRWEDALRFEAECASRDSQHGGHIEDLTPPRKRGPRRLATTRGQADE